MHVIHYSFVKTIECTTQRVNPNVNCEVQLIVMHPYWFINSNKYITLIKDVKNRRNCGWKCGDVKNTLLPAQMFSRPKTALKNSLLIFLKDNAT